jgi:apolipoprotein D and lipocalin family protein
MSLRIFGAALAGLLAACQSTHPPMDVVADVDLERYTGKWYEIASFPQYFQRGCVASSATYSLREDGRIDVLNECRDESFDGKLRQAEGVAWVVDPSESTAKLKVQFFWPFSGDYWIIALDPDYQYSVIGHPTREYLWILSRTPTMQPDRYARVLEQIESHGYTLDRLNRTPQPPALPSGE